MNLNNYNNPSPEEMQKAVKQEIGPAVDAAKEVIKLIRESGITKEVALLLADFKKEMIDAGFTPKETIDLLSKTDFSKLNSKK